jgi:hypothetical protein
MTCLTYLHERPNAEGLHAIFYVGKGSDHRAKSMWPRNEFHENVVKKHGKKNIVVTTQKFETEDEAFEFEKNLISILRFEGVRLTNLTDGGEGPKGLARPSGDEHWTRQQPDRVKHGSQHGNYGKIRSEESRRKNAEWHTGRTAWNKGIKERCITNGVEAKRIRAEQLDGYLADGWRIGRLPYKKSTSDQIT